MKLRGNKYVTKPHHSKHPHSIRHYAAFLFVSTNLLWFWLWKCVTLTSPLGLAHESPHYNVFESAGFFQCMRAISNKRLRANIAYSFVSLNWPTRNDFPIIALQPFFDWKREKTLSKHIWAHFKSQAKSPRSNRSRLSFTSTFETTFSA